MTVYNISASLKMINPPEPLVRVRECRHGLMAYFPHDIFIGGALERYGEYVESELELLLSCVSEGSIIVEVGANIGCDTVALAKKVTASGRVFAFEPQRIIYQMLCGNLAINGIWNVIAERAALGAGPGIMKVPPVDYSMQGNFGGVALQAAGDERCEPVQVIALDAYRMTRCDLLKIDVEGMELDVLKGAADTIKRLRPFIYCENDRPEKAAALVGHLRSLDYMLYWHVPHMFNPNNYRKCEENIYTTATGENIVSLNMLCLPREKNIVCPLQPVSDDRVSLNAGSTLQ